MGERLPKFVSRRAILKGPAGSVLGARSVIAETRQVSQPKPLARDAVTHDWTAYLGPMHNAVSTETKLSRKPQPLLVWEFTKGTGYASPAIAGERLVFLHRLRDEEIVECLNSNTGSTNWQFRTRPISKIGMATTTARDRVRSSLTIVPVDDRVIGRGSGLGR